MTTMMGFCIPLCVLLALQASAQDADATVPVPTPLTGGLTMNVQGEPESSAKQVGVTVQLAGQGAVAGVADVVGFPFIQNGAWSDTEWKVEGTTVTGTVKRKDGTVEGTFDGTITATGVSGSFTHSDGRVGLWSWDGPLPGQ